LDLLDEFLKFFDIIFGFEYPLTLGSARKADVSHFLSSKRFAFSGDRLGKVIMAHSTMDTAGSIVPAS
jgi:hypothetical protein